MRLADLVVLAGIKQDPLGAGGLARVDMGHDPEVAVALERIFACHFEVPLSGYQR